MDQTVAEVTWALPGEAAAMEALEDFLLKINPRVCYYGFLKNICDIIIIITLRSVNIYTLVKIYIYQREKKMILTPK
jgi:hypothetical protein